MKSWTGAIKVAVEDEQLFRHRGDIKDDMADDGWKDSVAQRPIKIAKTDILLASLSAPNNKSLDARGGRLFRNLRWSARVLMIRAAAQLNRSALNYDPKITPHPVAILHQQRGRVCSKQDLRIAKQDQSCANCSRLAGKPR